MSNSNAKADARQMTESARDAVEGASFLRELFAGRLRLDLIDPGDPMADADEEVVAYLDRLERFLAEKVDPMVIDEEGEYPRHVVDGLARLGAFGMKIPKAYGGLGLHHTEYVQAMKLLGSHDGNVTALLSAHQAIGVPQPILLFGTDEQKEKYLPRCAKGAISAFALTEPDVGSDPARVATTATPIEGGAAYRIDGVKLWCTNGTVAEYIVVMARDPETDRISAFVVPADLEGVEITHRCRFMGLSALENGLITFRGVRIPAENLIGEPGAGLRIALTTLNTGRLSLPAATTGAAKRCLEISRKWAATREQWGAPIGEHEAITAKLARMAATTFVMESVCDAVAALADDHDNDIRMEAAAAKEWNTVRAWEIVDEALQIRGGRGYETARSLYERGEAPIGIERMLRDARVNLIFEGSSEIMHLFIAREAVDEHLSAAGPFADPKSTTGDKAKHLPRTALHYANWYPRQWLGAVPTLWRYRDHGAIAPQLRYLDRATRRLSRTLFHGMVRYGASLEKKQRFLFRGVDAGMEIFAMSCGLLRAERLAASGSENAEEAMVLAKAYFGMGRRKIEEALRGLFDNDDAHEYGVGREVLAGQHAWLEKGIVPLGLEREELDPEEIDEARLAS